MKKIFTIISIVGLSLMMSSCLPDWIKKPDQVTTKLHGEIEYDFADQIDYFKAELISCYGVKDLNDPSIGTIHANIKITGNLTSYPRLRFQSKANDRDTYITEAMTQNQVQYDSKTFVDEVELGKGETHMLELEFPNVPSNFVKISRLYVSVVINEKKFYSFIIHQIPYLPKSDRILWR